MHFFALAFALVTPSTLITSKNPAAIFFMAIPFLVVVILGLCVSGLSNLRSGSNSVMQLPARACHGRARQHARTFLFHQV